MREDPSSGAVCVFRSKRADRVKEWHGRVPVREAAGGRIEIDSNIVERSILPIALTRENALFAGSDGGAQTWAIVATRIECCKLVDVEPYAYLTDVITRIVNGHLNSQLDELLPRAYQQPQAAIDVA